ncbi:helix-turn-helix domain-containing protein [Streptomyces zhihengii]
MGRIRGGERHLLPDEGGRAHGEGGRTVTVLQPLRGASAPLSVADSAPPARIVLGVYLRALRRAHRMSQRRSGRHDHVATSTISRVERAESPLKPERLEALLDVYSVAEKDRRYLLRSLLQPSSHRPPGVDSTRPMGSLGRRRRGGSRCPLRCRAALGQRTH